MFSTKAQNEADNCRFCWMCRHVCPVGQKTGKEANTPRAKGLLISLCERGQKFDESIAETMYECALCGACSNDCVTGFEPPVYIREARTMAVVEGLAPKHIQAVIDRLERTGNLYGTAPSPEPADQTLAAMIRDLPHQADHVLLLTETAVCQAPSMAVSAIRLLKMAGISFTVLWDTATGVNLGDLIGYVEETRAQAGRCIARLDETGASTVIALDPSDAGFLIQTCPAWGLSPQGRVVTLTGFIADLVSAGRLEPSPLYSETVTYHDPCRLARDLDETEPARGLIQAMGFSLTEMFLNRKLTKCCGGETMGAYSPDLASLTSEGRWEDAARTGAAAVITACPGCLANMGRQIPNGIKLYDLFTLLAEACSAKRR